jgi:hypothetical protein
MLLFVNHGGCSGAHGGSLVNLIHSYTDNGDPFVRKFTDELLEQVCHIYDVPPILTFLGVETLLRYIAEMAILRRVERSLFRVLCGQRPVFGSRSIFAPIGVEQWLRHAGRGGF